MIVIDGLKRLKKEEVIDYFKVLPQHLPGPGKAMKILSG
jgi:hypothetical protein